MAEKMSTLFIQTHGLKWFLSFLGNLLKASLRELLILRVVGGVVDLIFSFSNVIRELT